jgi:hypothetical protein
MASGRFGAQSDKAAAQPRASEHLTARVVTLMALTRTIESHVFVHRMHGSGQEFPVGPQSLRQFLARRYANPEHFEQYSNAIAWLKFHYIRKKQL